MKKDDIEMVKLTATLIIVAAVSILNVRFMLMYCSLLCKLFFGIDKLFAIYNNSVETDFELIIIVNFSYIVFIL